MLATGSMTADTFTRAVPTSDVPPGSKKAIALSGKQILVCNANGRLFAVSSICSHANESLECGRMGNGWIACPVHGARFDLATGAAKNPPAKQPIAVYAVRVVDDWIEVAV